MKKIVILSAVGTALSVITANPAQAVVACSVSDITPTAIACQGRFDKNILNASNLSTINSALTALSYTGPTVTNTIFGTLPSLTGLNGATTINPAGMFYGFTIVGVHVGNGQNPNGVGNTTSFYSFNAGSGMDSFGLNLLASSNVVVFQTGSSTSPAPEPLTWAMMVGGFGMIGGALRRRRRAVVTFT